MNGIWRIIDNHIALQCGNELMHPDAREVFGVVVNNKDNFLEGIDCLSPKQAFPAVRFSKIGSDVKCLLQNNDDDSIGMKLFCERNGRIVEVDVLEGIIVDQCVSEDEWFYVTGSVEEFNKIFEKLNILHTGRITTSQYVEIIRNEKLFVKGTIDNRVKTSLLDKSIDISETLPVGLQAKLYNYQKIGYFWMRYMLRENCGCILGDEMGLGKTLQVIALMLEFIHSGKTPMLVVVPVSLLQNWKRECEKFAPEIRTLIHHGSKRTGRYKELEEYDIIIVSYNAAVSDCSLLGMINWELVVLDEAQNIKNSGSERTRFVKKIPRKAGIAVTGTPFENHVTDIWSLVDFVIPGLLGTQSEYSNYITDDLEGADKIEPLLSPVMIRRRVTDVAKDLPAKVIVPQPIIMSDIEAMKYEGLRNEIKNDNSARKISLGMLQKLRMFCTHPLLCEDSLDGDYYSLSVKYQRMCEIISEIIELNEKVILFTSYQRMFTILECDIPDRFHIPVLKINGSTLVEERQNIVDQFNGYNGSVLLALNPRAAGTGLNITAANHVIHYNLEWNPSLEDQASARAYRRGQEKTVFIYRLFYEDTVEQIVNERIEHKRKIAEVAVVGTDGMEENKKDIIAAMMMSPVKG